MLQQDHFKIQEQRVAQVAPVCVYRCHCRSKICHSFSVCVTRRPRNEREKKTPNKYVVWVQLQALPRGSAQTWWVSLDNLLFDETSIININLAGNSLWTQTPTGLQSFYSVFCHILLFSRLAPRSRQKDVRFQVSLCWLHGVGKFTWNFTWRL